MDKNVFVLHTEVVLDCQLELREIIVFGSEGEAKENFKRVCEECRKEIVREGWQTDVSATSFESYPDGYYHDDHVLVELYETKIV